MPRSTRPPRYARTRSPTGVGVVVAVVFLAAGAGTAWLVHPSIPGLVTGAPPSSAVPAPAGPTTDPSTLDVPTTAAAPTPSATPTAVGIDLARYSTVDPSSLWVVVNKQHPIDPIRYQPPDLVPFAGTRVRAVVAADLQAMFTAAAADGVRLGLRTAYRPYDDQVVIHADAVRQSGAARADQYSARAGYSEHQTGLAMDLHSTSHPSCDLAACFASTAEAQWVAAHGWEYGLIVRYTPDNGADTGYAAEAWHLRYVGRDLAAWMHTVGASSLESVFGISGGADYPAG